jgi:ubiquinone/menaquinone biosynthesis C-methylase UbiE
MKTRAKNSFHPTDHLLQKPSGSAARARHRKGPSFRQAIFVCLLFCAGCAGLKQCAYEGIGRDEWQQPVKVVESLKIEPGQTIVDLGAGGGYFTFLLAEATGPAGKVYAVDVDQDMTGLLAQKARDQGVKNVDVILARPDNPMLPEHAVDLIFTANTYHHIDDRVDYFSALRQALRPQGRVAVIDFDDRSGWMSWFHHSTPSASIRREMEQAGYRLAQEFDFLDRQSFLVFEPSRP